MEEALAVVAIPAVTLFDALYLSVLGLTFISYGVTEWYLHRGK